VLELEKGTPTKKIIFLVDEIIAFGNPDSLDWRSFDPAGVENIIFSFSPLSLFYGDKTLVVRDSDRPAPPVECEQLLFPSEENFHHCALTLRYRNSQKLQQFTLKLGTQMKKYLHSKETPANSIPGEKPKWIDLGTDLKKLEPALKTVKQFVINDGNKAEDLVILYDRFLSNESIEKIKKTFHSHARWKDVEIIEEKLFRGCEKNTVIYVGPGHLEAFTRARLSLFIITCVEKREYFWYNKFKSAMEAVRDETLVEKIEDFV